MGMRASKGPHIQHTRQHHIVAITSTTGDFIYPIWAPSDVSDPTVIAATSSTTFTVIRHLLALISAAASSTARIILS